MGNETYVDGGLFREARERAGLSLGELAQALDVREEYLEALERGELGREPSRPRCSSHGHSRTESPSVRSGSVNDT